MVMNYFTLSNGLNLAYAITLTLRSLLHLSSNNRAIMDTVGLRYSIHKRVTELLMLDIAFSFEH